jgi:hypothetical protein
MATQVYKQSEIVLQDGTEVTLKPSPIGRLRRFMKAWQEFAEAKDDDDGFNVFINCAGIALEENFKGKFDSLKADKEAQEKGEVLDSEYKEYLEDTLDLETIYMVLDVCGGIKLNDPKLLEAAAALAENQE